MFKKLFAALLVLVLLVPDCALADGLFKYFLCPESFAYRYQENMEYFATEFFRSNGTDAERDALIQRLTISYTETQGSVMFYNNADWSLEVGFYYSDGTPSRDASATTLNFAIRDDIPMLDSIIARNVFLATVYCFADEGALNVEDLLAWSDETHDVNDSFDLGGYQLAMVDAEDYTQYVVLPNENFGGSASPASPSSPASPASGSSVLIDRDGFTATLVGIELKEYGASDVTLRFNLSIDNNTGRTVNLFVDNASVDGMPAEAVGCMGLTSGNTQDYFFINSDDSAALASALRSAGTVNCTFRLQDRSDYSEMFTQSATIDVSSGSADGGQAEDRGGDAFLSYDGFNVTVTGIERQDRDISDVKLVFHSIIENNSGRMLDFYVSEVKVNGVACSSFGDVDIPDGTYKADGSFYFASLDSYAAAQALRSPGVATFTVRIRDSKSLDLLYTTDYTIDLSQVQIYG